MQSVEKVTPCGAVRGIETERCLEFRSIRYAHAGRFQYPTPVKSFEGVYDATAFSDCCYQHRAFEDDAKVNAFYHKEFRKGLSFTYSEDCFFLNIWAPKNAENCPVVVYIHGGSFTGGSSNEGHISGVHFAENGVILVAMNYRLGPYGFCAHPDLTDQNGVCGNYGLFDQLAAIKWVKANIAAFGGDPQKITLMGQSAGAMSVDILVSSPLCKDLIAGAILLSGAGLQRFLLKPKTPEKTLPFWNLVLENAGVKTADELRTLDPKALYYAWLAACRAMKFNMPYTFPVYDGALLTKESFSSKRVPDMPYILGVTSQDMIPIVLQKNTVKWAKLAKKYNQNPCFVYNFTRQLPGDDRGAWHSADLLYAFSTLGFSWRPFSEIDYQISDALSASFCAFAESGDPNCSKIPHWTPGGKNPMRFCENTHCAPWETAKNFKQTFRGLGWE